MSAAEVMLLHARHNKTSCYHVKLANHSGSSEMASQNPRVTIAKPARANGVLSVPVSATQRGPRQNANNNTPRAPSAPSGRQKILIRRLPPGLTRLEFEEALGEEWKVGGEKVGWADYKPGKISKEYSHLES